MPLDPWATSVRYAASGRGHYESFYIKANHPSRRLGVWLKFNLFEPRGAADRFEGELWGVWFDGETGQHTVAMSVIPGQRVDARRKASGVRIGDAALDIGGDVLSEHPRVTGDGHELAWDVPTQTTRSTGRPLSRPPVV